MQLVDCGILWFGRLVYDTSRFVDSNKSISRPKLESLPILRRQIATTSKRSTALLNKMASFVWTNAKVEQFIEILETKECLYNATLKEYHNREKRRNAIQEIATALNATGTL